MGVSTIVLVHPDGDDAALVCALETAGYRVTAVEHPTVAVARLASGEFDCLVTVSEGQRGDDVSLLEAVRELEATLPVVVCTDEDNPLADTPSASGVDRFVTHTGVATVERVVDAVDTVTADDPPQDISGHEPDPEAIVRAIDNAPIGISLSDASLPDNPLVYINDAWEEVTGYDREYALGRNPRFLQGPETDGATTASIGTAIDNDVAITTEIRNYRHDGTPFWNELTVAPVTDGGELTHYVGFQHDVSDRKHAERTAQERAEKLAEERSALQCVLDRIHGLLNDVTEILVSERDRRVIAQRVCEEIVATEGYAGAWIGSPTPARADIELWGAAGRPAEVEPIQECATLPQSVQTALECETIETCTVGDCEGTRLDPAFVGATQLAAVPIGHDRKQYGVLCIYGTDERALDHRQRQLFDSIGRMIATRLNAIEASENLIADHVVEIEVGIGDRTFPLTTVAGELGADVSYVGLTCPPEADTAELILTIETDQSVDSLSALPTVVDVRPIAETNGESTIALTVDSTTPFIELGDHGASVAAIDATPEHAVVHLELPPSSDVRSILELLDSLYDDVSLHARHERDQRPQTANECASILESRLTERQRTALEAAYMNGYFEWPRPTDGDEIAETMGITRQTYHQHLRAAERKLVETFLDSVGNV